MMRTTGVSLLLAARMRAVRVLLVAATLTAAGNPGAPGKGHQAAWQVAQEGRCMQCRWAEAHLRYGWPERLWDRGARSSHQRS